MKKLKSKPRKYKEGGNIPNDTIRDPATLQRYKLKNGLIPDYILHEKLLKSRDKTEEKGFLDYADDILSAPQRAATYALTGKYQNPSEALGIKNKWGKMATDLVLDPMNLLGVGLAKKLATGAKAIEGAVDAGKVGEAINTTEKVFDYKKIKDFKDAYKNIPLDKIDIDFTKYSKYKDIDDAKYIVKDLVLTNEQKVLKLNKIGAGAAIINDLIQQDSNKETYYQDSYKPHYNFPTKQTVNNTEKSIPTIQIKKTLTNINRKRDISKPEIEKWTTPKMEEPTKIVDTPKQGLPETYTYLDGNKYTYEQLVKNNPRLKDPKIFENTFHKPSPEIQNGEQIQKYQTGGKVQPKYVTDPNDPRLRAYNDSLNLYKAMQMQDKLMGPGSSKSEHLDWSTAALKKARIPRKVKGFDEPIASDWNSEADMRKAFDKGEEENSFKLIKYYKSLGFTDKDIMYHTSPDIVNDKIKPTGTYWDGSFQSPVYKKPTQPVIYQPKEDVKKFNDIFEPTEYNKKYPPIYVSNPKDPRIGGYSEAGGVYLYKESTPKRKDIPLMKSKGLSNDNPELTIKASVVPETYMMPDGNKYTYDELLQTYPQMKNNKTFNKNLVDKSLNSSKRVMYKNGGMIRKYAGGGDIPEDNIQNPDNLGDKYGNQQLTGMRSNNRSSFFKSPGFQQGLQGATMGTNAYNNTLNQDSAGNPYRQKEEQTYQSTMSTIGSTGLVGSVIAGGSAAGDAAFSPIRNKSEKTDEYGRLKSRRSFINNNAAGSFMDQPRSAIAAFQDPDASTGEKIGSFFGWGAAFGGRRADRFEKRAINERITDENQAADNGNSDFLYMKDGGAIPNLSPINIEGKEILSDPNGRILKKYSNYPKHPKSGINPDGTVIEEAGNFVIPKKMVKTFEQGDRLRRQTMLMNLANQEPEMVKKRGGMIYKCENGLKIPKMDGENGSLVRRNPYFNFNEDTYSGIPTDNVSPYDFPIDAYTDYSQPFYRPQNPEGTNTPVMLNKSLIPPQNASGDNPGGDKGKGQRFGRAFGNAGGLLANNFGPLAYLIGEGKKYDKVNYGSVNPDLVDPREELAQNQLENNSLNNDIRTASGGNTGSYLTNRIVANRQNFMNKAKTLRDYANTNSSIKNQFKQYNKAKEIRAKEAEAQNRGQSQTSYYGALSNLGRNTVGSMSDAQKAKRDEQMLKLYSNIYQNYDFNPDTYEFTRKKDKTKD